jgi:hypothetical protein
MNSLRCFRIATFAAAVLFLALAATSASAETEPPTSEPSEFLEAPRGVVLDGTGAMIQVDSGGCTTRDSFRFEYSEGEIRMYRLGSDHCEAHYPHGEVFRYTWAELGVPNEDSMTPVRFWQGERSRAPMPPTRPSEAIYGVVTTAEGATFQVHFGGCGQQRDFAFEIVDTGIWPLLYLQRTNEDMCELYAPIGTTFTFTWAEMGVLPGVDTSTIQIGNAIVAP